MRPLPFLTEAHHKASRDAVPMMSHISSFMSTPGAKGVDSTSNKHKRTVAGPPLARSTRAYVFTCLLTRSSNRGCYIHTSPRSCKFVEASVLSGVKSSSVKRGRGLWTRTEVCLTGCAFSDILAPARLYLFCRPLCPQFFGRCFTLVVRLSSQLSAIFEDFQSLLLLDEHLMWWNMRLPVI